MGSFAEKSLILLGAGGHARVLVDSLRLSGVHILGVTDPTRSVGESVFGIPLLGRDEVVFDYNPREIILVNGIGFVEHNSIRQDLAERMRSANYEFLTVVHPKATTASNIQLEEGVQVMSGAVLQVGTTIGRDTIVNTGALIDHDCLVGSCCQICPGTTIAGRVTIGDEVFLGTGSVVVPGITIGDRSVIAAGSVIYKDVPPGITFIQRKNETK
jgi:UDP-perosamine 4-acetyltransferase